MSLTQTIVVLSMIAVLTAAIVSKYNGHTEEAILLADIECMFVVSGECWKNRTRFLSGKGWNRNINLELEPLRKIKITYRPVSPTQLELNNLVRLGGKLDEDRQGVVFERLIPRYGRGINAFRYLINQDG